MFDFLLGGALSPARGTSGVDLILAVVRTYSPASLFQGLPLLSASSPREGGIHSSTITAALDLLLLVIAISWPSNHRISLFLILFKKVIVERG
jgi:hypothetical protein